MLATDYYDDALLFAAFNTERATGRAARTRMVDWNVLPPDIGQFEFVFAADVLYEMRYAPVLADVIAQTLAPGGVFVLSDQGRIALPAFLDDARIRARVKEVVRGAVRTCADHPAVLANGTVVTIDKPVRTRPEGGWTI